jgi:dipeptidyl aminopeptidase/acylaminoacyl peptidase
MLFLFYLKRLPLQAVFIAGACCLSSLCFFSVSGQVKPHKQITEADYDKWATLWPRVFSVSGNWMSYQVDYASTPDTLFVQSTKSMQTYIFPAGTDGRFAGEQYFACLMPEARLHLVDLGPGKVKVLSHVKRYNLAMQGKYIITLDGWYGEKSTLKIFTKKGNLVDSIEGVTQYKLNVQEDALLYATNTKNFHQIGILHFENYEKQLLASNSLGKFHQLSWQKDGQSMAYLAEVDSASKTQVVNFYKLDTRRNYSIKGSGVDLTGNAYVVDTRRAPEISDDGKAVIVAVSMKNPGSTSLDKNAVEIWNGNDERIHPATVFVNTYDMPIVKLCWAPENSQFKQVTSDSLPEVLLNGNMDYALIYNTYAYGRLPSYYPKTDYYLKHIPSGREQLLLERQSSDPGQITFSPKGDKILYYKEKNWWIYDIVLGKHLNITQGMTALWGNESEISHQFEVYGFAGWTADGKSVLIYDRYDLWSVTLDGSMCTRLTHGREKQMVFRIAGAEYHDLNGNYLGAKAVEFDLSKDIMLDVLSQDDWSTGFALYSHPAGVRSLVFGRQRYEGIQKSKSGFIYTSQTFNEPPKLVFLKELGGLQKVLCQSNKQQQNFNYGKAELIKYSNADGDSLKAAVFYPAGYDPSRRYPMIVHVYETESKELHRYQNPTLLNSEGFNISNFTLNGYIVLLPDIRYQLGNPAVSASNCIIAAVKAVIKMGIVIPDKIGLMGHSFGGYETNHVLTQTGLFAAAVSGAGISDVIGFYFNVGENHGMLPDMWRFESQQQRMGKSLYDDKAGYLRNSPIMSAEKINTPLLLWTGKRDRVVPMDQSVKMYLALRRLGRKTILLAYPNEDHTLNTPANKIDLSKRIVNWFDYYLKGEKPADWMKKEVGKQTGK